MNWLLDTSVAILLRDADTDADRRIGSLASVPALSIVTQVELEGGVVANPRLSAGRRAALDILLEALPVLPFDGACADAYRRVVESAGFVRARVADRMIAATALANGLGLITCNGADFRDIPGLALNVWRIEA